MIIQSESKSESLEIELQPSIEPNVYPTGLYLLKGTIREYSVTSDGVIFEFPEKFLEALGKFERTREGSVLLNGTEDCRVPIEPDGGSGAAWLDFAVAKYRMTASRQTGKRKSAKISLMGGFSIPGEYIGKLVEDFQHLFTTK